MKNTMLKIATLAALLLPAQAAFSQTSQFDGPYMGVEGSYAQTKNNAIEIIEPEIDGVYLENDVPSTSFRNPKYDADGVIAGLFFGYRLSEGQFTLAAEASYSNNFVENDANVLDSFELTSEFGFAIQPGVWLNENVVLYGHLGATQLRAKSRAGNETFDSSDTGLVFGAGIQMYINEQLSIRGSYTRSTHNHKTGEWIDIYTIADGDLVFSDVAYFEYDSTLRRNKFSASLVYNF